MMNKVLASITIFWATQVYAQIVDPQIINLDSFGAEYLPKIREFDGGIDSTVGVVRAIESPHLTKTIAIVKESDLTQTTYDKSFAKAILIEGEKPRATIEISRYRSFNISWLNEELIHISNSPGRCVELHTIYSTIENRTIYVQGFNHCGV